MSHILLLLFICFSQSVFIQQLSPRQCDREQEGGEGHVVPVPPRVCTAGAAQGACGPFLCPWCCCSCTPTAAPLSACLEMSKTMTMPVGSGWKFVPFSWSLSSPVTEEFHPGGCVFPKPCWSLHSPHCTAWVVHKHTFQHLCIHHSILSFKSSCPFPPSFSAPCMSCYTLFLHA